MVSFIIEDNSKYKSENIFHYRYREIKKVMLKDFLNSFKIKMKK